MPREELRWTPGVPDCDLMMYLRAARSMAAFAGMCDGGSAEDGCLAASRDDTTINALDLLHDSQYDTGRALQALVKNPVPRGLDKKWTDEDQKRFVKGLRQYGKNFFKIRKELLSHKETADLVEFYYLWKKTPGAATSRPHRRHRRQNVLRRSRPSSRLTKVAQNEFADASSASEEEESADDSDSREVPAYMCHSCLATSSKEWFQTGKEGSVLCWDCCQQKKGTEAVRPLSTSDGDGAPPFLFKPVDGDALNGKHVMRTRRNKENQNHTKGRSKHGSNNGGDGASPENMDGALTANNRTTPGGRKSPAASTADKDKKKKTNPDTPTKGKKRGRDEATPASNALPTTPTTPNASPVEDSAEVPAVVTPITTVPSPVNEEDDKTAASSAAKKKKGEAAESPVDSPGAAEGLSSRSSSVGGGAASNEENAPEEPEATSVSPPSVPPSPTAAPTPAAVPPATSVAEEPSQTASMPPQLPSPVEEERPSSRQPEPSPVANDGPPKEARCSPAVAEDAPVALPISRPPCPSPVSLVMPGMPSQVPHLERSPQLLPPRMSPPVPPPAHQLIGRGVSTPPTRNLTPSPKLMMSEDKFDQLLPQAPPTLSLPDPREKSPAAPPDAMPLSLIKMEVEESKPLRLVSSPSSRGRPTPPLPLSGSMNPSLAALSAMPPPPVEPLLPSGMMPPTVKSHLVRIKEEMSGPPTLLMEGPPRGLPPSSSSGVSPLPPEATQSLAATGPPLGVPRGLSPLAPLPPSSSSCLPASSLAAAGASAPPRSSPSSVPGAPVDYPGPPPHHVKTEPPPSPPKERLSAPSPPHHMPSFSHSSSPAHIKPVPCSLSMPTPPTSTPASSASSHHYPFSPPLFATSSVAVSTAASPLGGGYPSPLVTAGRPPPGAAPPPGAPPQVHPGFPYPAYFSPQLYSPHLHFPQTHPQFAPPPPAPPPPAHQATAPQHHSKTPPSRAPVSMPLPPQLPLDGGGGGSGHRVAPPSHHGGSGGHHSGGLSSHHSSSSSHHGGPVHHIVPEEEEEEPEAQQLVRGPSPEPKVEDSECHRSQSAIFLRHWSRGEFNSCARTDLTFKPVPDSKLARKREERARKAAEKEREEAKQRLSSLEHRSGASESKAGPSGHPCDFPPGANPYRTAPPRGAVTNPYAAAAAAAAAADTPALRQLSEYARPHAGFSPSGYPSARAHPAAAAAAAAAAAMDPMMLHYQLGMYAAAAAASRENSLRLDLELEKRELQDKLKAELELKSRLPQAYDPHWLELQRRYAAAAGLGAAGGALGAAAAGMSPFALYGDQRDRLGLPPDDRLHPAADRLALAAADPLLRLQMAGELHAVPPTHAHAHTHLHLHPPHHDPLSAAAVAMAMPPGGEPPPTAGPYATGYPPGGPGAAPPGSAGGPPRGAPHGPPPGGPRPQDLMHPAAAALMRSSYEEQLAHQINAAQVAAAQQQQQHEQLQRQFMLERERLAHLSALGAAHAASAHQAQAAQLLPQHEEFLRWRPTVPRQDLSSDCSATARRCSQQQQRERELKLRTLEEAARGGRPPIN